MSRTPNHPGGAPAPGGTPGPARHPAARPAVAHAPAPAAAAVKPSAAAKPLAPAKPSAAPQPATTQPAAPQPAAPATPPPRLAAHLTRRNLIIAGSAAAAVLLVALVVWKPWAPNPPRLNSDPGVIAKFAASSSMRRLPFDQQRQFMEILDEKHEAVEKAYDDGRLSDQEFRRALQLAWYGEHLKKMDKFFGKPPTLQMAYLDQQVDRKIRKKKKNKSEKPDSASALTTDEIDRDDSTEEQDVKGWPSDVRERWSSYRAAYASRKQFWKDYAKEHKGEHHDKKSAEAKKDAKGGPDTAPSQTGAEAAAPSGTPSAQ